MMNAILARIRAKTVAVKRRLRATALPITRVNQMRQALGLNRSYRSQSL
jgi:hypothetical protein